MGGKVIPSKFYSEQGNFEAVSHFAPLGAQPMLLADLRYIEQWLIAWSLP